MKLTRIFPFLRILWEDVSVFYRHQYLSFTLATLHASCLHGCFLFHLPCMNHSRAHGTTLWRSLQSPWLRCSCSELKNSQPNWRSHSLSFLCRYSVIGLVCGVMKSSAGEGRDLMRSNYYVLCDRSKSITSLTKYCRYQVFCC